MRRYNTLLGFLLGTLVGAVSYGVYRVVRDVSKYPEDEFHDSWGDGFDDLGATGFGRGMDIDSSEPFVTGFEDGKMGKMERSFGTDSKGNEFFF